MVRDLLQLMYVGMGWLMGLEGAAPRESPSFFNGVGDEGIGCNGRIDQWDDVSLYYGS
jgi:hypothetical protein